MQDSLGRFREDVRSWLETNCPESMRKPAKSDDELYWGGRGATFASEDQQLWFERMVAQGWTAPTWPKEYGGAALSAEEADVLRQELTAMGCRSPLAGWGLTLLGPTLLRYGSDLLKRQHLPAIARGEVRFCQGFSEPNAGSDLAALSTAADAVDGGFRVNGQKIWTTYGDRSDWMFCLVRTDRAAPKREGISFILLEMRSPGVAARPIPLISGTSEFCEVFFDDVFVPGEQLVGEINRGWDVTKFLLTCEREVSGRVKAQGATSLGTAIYAGRPADDPLQRRAVAQFDIEATAFTALLAESAQLDAVRIDRPGLGSAIKYIGSELNKWRLELQMSLGGFEALGWNEAEPTALVASTWLRTKANSIAGGSNEMQFNMTARQVLGLPDRPTRRNCDGETVDFDEDVRLVRQAVRGTLQAASAEAGVRALRGKAGAYSAELWRNLCENGYAAVLAPAEHGGLQAGMSAAAVIAEELGRTIVRQPFLSSAVVGMAAISASGHRDLADGSQIIAMALDESAKHDPTAREVRLQADGEGFVLTGMKRFVADANAAEALIVSAALPSDEPALVVVPAAAEGVSRRPLALVDEGDWADVVFAGVRIARGDVLAKGATAKDILATALDAGRIGAAGELLGIGDEACDRTVAFLKTRRQFDHYLAEYQALQHRIARVHMRLDLARAAVHAAARGFDEHRGPSALAAAAKFLADQAATLAVQEAVQLHGGIAMTDAADIGFLMKRARVLGELYGDADFQANLFAERMGY